MKLRVGLVGLGEAWDFRHRPALLTLRDRFEVCAVCEQIGLRAQQVAQEFSAAAVEGYRELTLLRRRRRDSYAGPSMVWEPADPGCL